MRSKADVSWLNLLHETKNKTEKQGEKLKTNTDMLRRNDPVKSPAQIWRFFDFPRRWPLPSWIF